MFTVLPKIAFLLSLFLWPAASHAASEAEWNSLMTQVKTMLVQGKAKEGVPLAVEAVKQAEELYGIGSPNVLTSLGLLAMLYQGAGDQEQAAAIRGQMALQAMNRSRDLASSRMPGKGSMTGQAMTPQEDPSKPAPRNASSNDPLAGKDLLAEQAKAVQEHMKKQGLYNPSPNASRAGDPQKHVIDSARAMGMGDQADAMQKMREALEKQRGSTGKATKSGEAVNPMSGLKEMGKLSLLTSQGQYLEALPIAEQSVKQNDGQAAAGSPMARVQEFNLAQLYFRLAMYEKAEPLFRRLLERAQREAEERMQKNAEHLGSMKDFNAATNEFSESMKKKDSATARYFEERTRQLEGMRNQLDAMQKAEAERSHGPQADYLYSLAQIYHKLGRYKDAEQHYQQAVELSSKGIHRMDLILLYMDMGDYAKAKSLAREKQEELTGASGQGERAILLDKQAQVYMALGNYQEAEKFLTGALKMWKTSIHDGQEVYFMNKLARVYRASGRYGEAQTQYAKAIDMAPDRVRAVPRDGAPVLSEFAQLQQELGMYEAAKRSGEVARKIQTEALGPDHPETLSTVMVLGQLAEDKGENEEAESLLKTAMEAFKKRLGERHPATAGSLFRLAQHYHRRGKLEQARPLYEAALQVREEKLLPDHLDIASTLISLAKWHLDMGYLPKAEELNQRALKIYDRVLGTGHPETGAAHKSLGDVALQERDLANAERHYQESRAIFEGSVGHKHLSTAGALVGLARVKALEGHPKDALELLQQAVAIEGPVLLMRLGTVREHRKLQLLRDATQTKDLVMALVERYLSNDKEAVRFALDLVLERKGLVFDDQAQLEANLPRDIRMQLRSLKQEIATLQDHPAASMKVEQVREKTSEAISRWEQLDAQMRQKGLRLREAVTSESVAKAMPSASVLIEFVEVVEIDWASFRTRKTSNYLAFVLRPDKRIHLARVGASSEIGNSVDGFHRSLGNDVPASTREEKSEIAYEKVWMPIQSLVGDAAVLIVSPDGKLNELPFAALLHPQDDQFLIEKHSILYVTSGRDLLRPRKNRAGSGELIIFANPDFGGSTITQGECRESGKRNQGGEAVDHFSPLPCTQEEADMIPGLVKQKTAAKRVFTQKTAQEEVVLNVHQPQVLHLATHGYFAEKGTGPLNCRPNAIDKSDVGPQPQQDNPLVRSGLAMTGANNACNAGNSIDGLLTAYELSGVDLQGTDLVTLSACQTGTGDIENGDGVYGLRRVLALAGARNVVMSLWRVDDLWTARQMKSFYRAYGEGRSPMEALRSAQLATLADLIKEGRTRDPRLWAAFIVQGVPGLN